jgi:predicted negative regulator of RcsB-dependent stress response
MLYKAKALQIEGQLEDAKSIYQQLDKENVGNISAEARYQIAVILFNQKRNDAAEKAASYAAQASNNSPYWAAKNYILLADILTDNKDYFNAKATLQSIIKNSKDQELVSLAQQKLEQVKALESAKSKISE